MNNDKRRDVADNGWLTGGGEMGALIRAKDWSKTSLGPIESWPHSLRTTVSICLASDLPICIIWGPGLVQIYNAGYRVICGEKHPRSMGQNFAECWREAWPVIGDAHDSALAGDTAFLENQHIFLERHGYVEECFFTFSFSPIRDESGRVVGLFHPVIEMTAKMLGERRTRALRDVAARTADAKTVQEACALAAQSLAGQELDVPFALTYVFDGVDASARLVASTGIPVGAEGNAMSSGMLQSWPLAEVPAERQGEVVKQFEARFGDLRCGPYPESPREAVALPLVLPGAERPVGVLIMGVSGRLQLNQEYRGFYELLGAAVTTAVANGRAFEEERKRAEALAEIDRAKTAFFSNISHELRTPLTLMLGPLEDLKAEFGRSTPSLDVSQYQQVDLAHRNGLRLLKMVNTLLDFSRIEAGRAQVLYEETDLAAFTADLASVFRSAIEKAGLSLIVDCPPLPEHVFVDCDMWEKIVLNLLSNAFKFTFEGEIEVALRPSGKHVELSIRDTGTGIPEDQFGKIFERFHRVAGSQGRTFEGTGIGLSLVQELARLHGGSVSTDSVYGKGSTFTVTIPFGTAHLDPQRIGTHRRQASTATGVIPFVEEALHWLPDEDSAECSVLSPELSGSNSALTTQDSALPSRSGLSTQDSALRRQHSRPQVLLADDNADMREYVRRLLRGRFEVQAVADGQAALEAAQADQPDLVLADVMMPRLDGFGLLRALRDNSATKTIPIILLSARAGEESRVEGLEHGADDYLIKPFSARELLARVQAHLDMARIRRDAEQRVTNILESLTDGFHVIDADGRFTHFNRAARRMFIEQGIDPDTLIGKHMFDAFPDAREQPAARALQRTLAERVPTEAENFYAPWGRWFAARHYPTADGGASTFFQDITEPKEAENALRESEERFARFMQHLPGLAWIKDAQGRYVYTNDAVQKAFHTPQERLYGKTDEEIFAPEVAAQFRENDRRVLASGTGVQVVETVEHQDGLLHHSLVSKFPIPGANGQATLVGGMAIDITERKRAEEALRDSEQKLQLELQDTLLLHRLAMDMAKPAQPEELYERLMDAAVEIMRSDYASMQMFFPERGDHGELLLLAQRGFNLEGVKYWKWVALHTGSTCGQAFRTRERSHVFDVEQCEFMQGDDLAGYLNMGMHSAQTTPLISRSGVLIGMISTHWKRPHQPSERDFRMFDVLARHAGDLIERKKAEEALRQSEEHQRLALSAGKFGQWQLDLASMDLKSTTQFKGNFGRAADDPFTYEIFRASLHPEDRPTVEQRIAEAITQCGDYEADYRCIWPDGSVHWINARGRALGENGKAAQLVGVTLDITERKQAEEALRKSKERFDIVSDAAEVGFWFCDLPFDELIWDHRVKEHFWLPPDAPVTIETFYGRLHPDDRERTRQSIEESIANNTRYEIEYRTLSPEGEEKWIRAVGRTFCNEHEKPIRFDGVTLDITERKRTQERLAQFTAELEERVAERTYELAQSEDRLRTLATELNLAEQRERKRLAGELHDYLAQLLVLGCLKLGQVRRAGLPAKVEETVKETEEVLTQALNYSRTLMAELSPSVLQEHGLPAGLT